jgi:transcriptional regulator with XRE-family HTH domain
MKILRKLRENKGITQAELGKVLSISPSTIGMYEQGRRSPDYETLKKIADYFGVSTDCLLGREKPIPFLGDSNGNSELSAMMRELQSIKASLNPARSKEQMEISMLKHRLQTLTTLQQAYDNAPLEIQAAVDAVLAPYSVKEKEKEA